MRISEGRTEHMPKLWRTSCFSVSKGYFLTFWSLYHARARGSRVHVPHFLLAPAVNFFLGMRERERERDAGMWAADGVIYSAVMKITVKMLECRSRFWVGEVCEGAQAELWLVDSTATDGEKTTTEEIKDRKEIEREKDEKEKWRQEGRRLTLIIQSSCDFNHVTH